MGLQRRLIQALQFAFLRSFHKILVQPRAVLVPPSGFLGLRPERGYHPFLFHLFTNRERAELRLTLYERQRPVLPGPSLTMEMVERGDSLGLEYRFEVWLSSRRGYRPVPSSELGCETALRKRYDGCRPESTALGI